MGNKTSEVDRGRTLVYIREFAKMMPVFTSVFNNYYNNKNRNRDNKFKEDVLQLLNGVRKVVESDVEVTRAGKKGNILRLPINSKYEAKVFLTYDKNESSNILNQMGVKGLNLYDKSRGRVYKLMTVVNENDKISFKMDVDTYSLIHGNKAIESAIK